MPYYQGICLRVCVFLHKGYPFRAYVRPDLLGQGTIFGWVLTGPVASSSQNRVSAFTTQITETSDRGLEKLITKFWKVENIPTKRLKKSDSYCESNFLQTTTRDASDRYFTVSRTPKFRIQIGALAIHCPSSVS